MNEVFRLASPEFENNGLIPATYTCKKRNVSPPLEWRNFPDESVSFALVMVDLDTPFGVLTHWVLYNIPSRYNELPPSIPSGRNLPDGIVQGVNGMLRRRYMGPCPPWGSHRYLFTLYALDAILEPISFETRRRLTRYMSSHIVAKTEFTGLFSHSDV